MIKSRQQRNYNKEYRPGVMTNVVEEHRGYHKQQEVYSRGDLVV